MSKVRTFICGYCGEETPETEFETIDGVPCCGKCSDKAFRVYTEEER